jgi:DNA mismatch repair protein MutL
MNENKIQVLPEYISNKIAAGEVVQRPASVLKELLENAIDAEAKTIVVLIKDAGKSLIQVIDDGMGMSEADSVKCIERHATSKISSIEDLERIRTFGFRGEALSSIASVSHLEIKTERENDELGTFVRYDDENGLKIEKGSFSKGTSVSVKGLFYNVPARRNFLKTNSTELKHLTDVFKRTALSNPEISFEFWNDGDIVFDFKQATIEERMEQVFADNIFDVIVPVEERTDFIELHGFIAKPNYLKKSRSDQYLFVNRRFVLSKVVNHAVFSAYENILEKGDYPFFVLFLKIDFAKVDVNVHPSKMEIKFEDDKDIYLFVNAVIKKALGKYDLVPNIPLRSENEGFERLGFHEHRFTEKNDFSDRPNPSSKNFDKSVSAFSDGELDAIFNSISPKINYSEEPVNLISPFEKEPENETQTKIEIATDSTESNANSFIVSLHNKYILTAIKSGLMIIDHHVAHERILYEKALKSMDSDLPFSQQLLFDQQIQLDPSDYELLKELEPYLIKLGFEIKFLPKRTIAVNGVPSDIKVGSEIEILNEIIKDYRQHEVINRLAVKDNLAKSYSCKAAIKAGDKISEHEMRLLVDKLFATSMPYVCPHGRPIIIKIPLEEFDKRFGRTS